MITDLHPAFTEAKAVLFDFDGIVLDTEWPIYMTWKALFEREGQELPPEIYVKCIGSDFDTWSPETYLEELTGKQFDWETENAARQVDILKNLEGSPAMPGAVPLIECLAEHPDILTAVVSSSSHHWVDGWLEKLDLSKNFNTTVCRGDAPRIKPAPDLYLEAARQLGVAPSDCLVIEDSMNGMISAHQAGMQVVVVPNRLTSVLDFSEADWQTKSLAELVPVD
ncbi:HAD family phosphatase [Verrucomicrobiaceae bacterium R5-34]|uniref:HAD family phosphatase n=1 Tax=Oceaniferula flava TaxID=2800421 RepID=A0AAE2S9A9_9BACT|nr:HAD family phosphatase [Oceaniferula flavus]MBK1831590.1 HAD family phosphatase [Verrucomicrobiaceae bacterium R5-34]MBK1854073.1 HAD family phosphatase [Oceaniferula flavus]MBM1135379.1 HAD family phosphatase [Oceaniferula flavus]